MTRSVKIALMVYKAMELYLSLYPKRAGEVEEVVEEMISPTRAKRKHPLRKVEDDPNR